MYFKIEIGILD